MKKILHLLIASGFVLSNYELKMKANYTESHRPLLVARPQWMKGKKWEASPDGLQLQSIGGSAAGKKCMRVMIKLNRTSRLLPIWKPW